MKKNLDITIQIMLQNPFSLTPLLLTYDIVNWSKEKNFHLPFFELFLELNQSKNKQKNFFFASNFLLLPPF